MTRNIHDLRGTRIEQDIRNAFQKFIKDNGREPTVIEMDESELFPLSVRQMQRMFGGIKNLRKQLGYRESFTEGDVRTETARHINERGLKIEQDMFSFLNENYNEVQIHRNYLYCDDRRKTADFCIWDRIPEHRDIIDVFYPKDIKNFSGCINSKQRKHNDLEYHFVKGTWHVWFVCANPEITQDMIDTILKTKKKTLNSYQRCISYEVFKNIFKK